MAMENFLRKAREAREFLTPVLKNSKFLNEGILTPEEFVKAGDNLVYKCPTWRWESGDPRHRKPYLPENKQYLCTRGVPCRARVSVMEAEYAKTAASAFSLDGDEDDSSSGGKEGASGGGGGGGDWTVLTDGEKKSKAAVGGGAEKVPASESDAAESAAATGDDGSEDSDDDSDYLDMEAFEEENLAEVDPAAVPAQSAQSGTADSGQGGGGAKQAGRGSNIENTRTYDLSITYDNYYKTPRVWLFGYDEHSSPLPSESIFEDIAVDYRKRTVTIDPHPHLHDMMHASIHPCKHAAVMKRIVAAMLSKQNEPEDDSRPLDEQSAGASSNKQMGPSVEAYLFIFLKFIQSVIPTIDYDFTMSVSFNLGNNKANGS